MAMQGDTIPEYDFFVRVSIAYFKVGGGASKFKK